MEKIKQRVRQRMPHRRNSKVPLGGMLLGCSKNNEVALWLKLCDAEENNCRGTQSYKCVPQRGLLLGK